MEKIKITFLGTSSSIPTRKRNHSAILLSYKNENILIDCGEGTQRQFSIADLSPTKLTKILITHWHGDHILGLPGLCQTLAMNGYSKTLEIYGPKKTRTYLSLLKQLIKIHLRTSVEEISSGKFFENSDFYLESLPMKHGTPTLAYSFIVKDKLRLDKDKIKKLKLPNSPLLKKLQNGEGIIIGDKKIRAKEVSYMEKGRKITFVLDTLINDNAVKLAKNSDLLICESSFSKKEEKLAEEYLHLTAEQSATIAKKAKVKSLILTHLSRRYDRNPEPILEEAKKIFKNTSLAKDFDVIEL